jgi:hypothetical protein
MAANIAPQRTSGQAETGCSVRGGGGVRDGSRSSALAGRLWRAQVFVRGYVRHPDHTTIVLRGWHRLHLHAEFTTVASRSPTRPAASRTPLLPSAEFSLYVDDLNTIQTGAKVSGREMQLPSAHLKADPLVVATDYADLSIAGIGSGTTGRFLRTIRTARFL